MDSLKSEFENDTVLIKKVASVVALESLWRHAPRDLTVPLAVYG